MEEWAKRQMVNGKVDWREQLENLISVAKQYVEAPTSFAAKSILLAAIEAEEFLLKGDFE